jgi:prepilin-type N-terminal cleavage/methylation domain-containing protein
MRQNDIPQNIDPRYKLAGLEIMPDLIIFIVIVILCSFVMLIGSGNTIVISFLVLLLSYILLYQKGKFPEKYFEHNYLWTPKLYVAYEDQLLPYLVFSKKAMSSEQRAMRKAGFSLIELMVVMAVLGIIMTTGWTIYRIAASSARVEQQKKENISLTEAAVIYKKINGTWPSNSSQLTDIMGKVVKTPDGQDYIFTVSGNDLKIEAPLAGNTYTDPFMYKNGSNSGSVAVTDQTNALEDYDNKRYTVVQ